MDLTPTLEVFTVFVFGLIIGSFLNVVILRWNTGMRIVNGRSACFSCGKTLEWYELIPLVSFIVQKRVCRKCGAKISWRYPLIELAGGLAFVVARLGVPDAFSNVSSFAAFILTAALLCVYIVICAYDLRHKIIPDAFSYLAGLISIGLMIANWSINGRIDPYQVVAGPALFIFFWAFWFFSKGKWMGLGDGKLALSVGWTLGFSQGLAALLLSFWIGAAVSLAAMAFQKLSCGNAPRGSLNLKSEIPFGPFLIAGFLITFIYHMDIPTILSHLAL